MMLRGAKDDKERAKIEAEINRPPVVKGGRMTRPARLSAMKARQMMRELEQEDAVLGGA